MQKSVAGVKKMKWVTLAQNHESGPIFEVTNEAAIQLKIANMYDS